MTGSEGGWCHLYGEDTSRGTFSPHPADRAEIGNTVLISGREVPILPKFQIEIIAEEGVKPYAPIDPKAPRFFNETLTVTRVVLSSDIVEGTRRPIVPLRSLPGSIQSKAPGMVGEHGAEIYMPPSGGEQANFESALSDVPRPVAGSDADERTILLKPPAIKKQVGSSKESLRPKVPTAPTVERTRGLTQIERNALVGILASVAEDKLEKFIFPILDDPEAKRITDARQKRIVKRQNKPDARGREGAAESKHKQKRNRRQRNKRGQAQRRNQRRKAKGKARAANPRIRQQKKPTRQEWSRMRARRNAKQASKEAKKALKILRPLGAVAKGFDVIDDAVNLAEGVNSLRKGDFTNSFRSLRGVIAPINVIVELANLYGFKDVTGYTLDEYIGGGHAGSDAYDLAQDFSPKEILEGAWITFFGD